MLLSTVLNQKVSNNDSSNNKNIKIAIARIVIVMMMERTTIIRIVQTTIERRS